MHPDTTCAVKQLFGLDIDMEVPAFSGRSEYVPDIDESYCFDHQTTFSILAGFAHNRRVMVQGYHGTGKSTHIEQVAARLNWPCLRVNLDGHITRTDLIGRDAIVVRDGQQVTEFKDGIIPWSLKQPMALIFDEYDSARPDVMFVLQRLLEAEGHFTLMDENKVLVPHPEFRIFATSNTVGLGDHSGLYHGVQFINQGQMDRWNIVTTLNYVASDNEVAIVLAKIPQLQAEKSLVESMVSLANLTREALKAGDISTVMSPRTVLSWAENYRIFNDIDLAFMLTFMNKCEESEKAIIAELYQRCFDREPISGTNAVA